MSEENKLPYKIIAAFIAVLALIFLILYVYGFLSTGRVTITTDSATNVVKITQSVDTSSGNKLFSKQSVHSISTRLKPGLYEISAYVPRGQNSSSQTIQVKARESKNYIINPSVAGNSEPVYGSRAGSVFADSSQLLFLDLKDLGNDLGESGHLMQIGSGGSLNTIFADHTFSTIKWASPGFGLAQDTLNNLYIIKNGQLSQLNLPFGAKASTKLSSDINRYGEIYISDGTSVYSGFVSGNFRKIYTANSSEKISNIAAGSQRVGVSANPVEALESQRNSHRAYGSVAVITDDGSVDKKSFGAVGVSWSPNYKYLLAQSGLSEAIFDYHLHRVNSISVNNASNFIWRDNGSLFYSINGRLWVYDIQSKRSNIATTLLAGGQISAVFPSLGSDYVYFSANNGGKNQLFRVALPRQAIDSSLGALPIFLPEVIHSCSLNYINFGSPTILVGSPPGQLPADCVGTAQEETQYYGLDNSKLQFQNATLIGE